MKIGIPGSEQRLALILHRYGTKGMATDFLNSGSSALAESARRWAAANGYYITHTGGHAGARWGAF